MDAPLMHLKILVPSEVFADKQDVLRVVVGTTGGSYGLLPRRLDCAASLTSGILSYETVTEGPMHVAIAEGVLLKTGPKVFVSVRRAVGGADLGLLREMVNRELSKTNEQERRLRVLLARLESGFVRQFMQFKNG